MKSLLVGMKYNIVNVIIISSFFFVVVLQILFPESFSWYIKKHRGYSKIRINRQNFPS